MERLNKRLIRDIYVEVLKFGSEVKIMNNKWTLIHEATMSRFNINKPGYWVLRGVYWSHYWDLDGGKLWQII